MQECVDTLENVVDDIDSIDIDELYNQLEEIVEG